MRGPVGRGAGHGAGGDGLLGRPARAAAAPEAVPGRPSARQCPPGIQADRQGVSGRVRRAAWTWASSPARRRGAGWRSSRSPKKRWRWSAPRSTRWRGRRRCGCGSWTVSRLSVSTATSRRAGWWTTGCGAAGARVRMAATFDNIETIKNLVEIGSGVSLLPGGHGAAGGAGRDARRPAAGAGGCLPRPTGLLLKKTKVRRAAVRAFVEAMRAGTVGRTGRTLRQNRHACGL